MQDRLRRSQSPDDKGAALLNFQHYDLGQQPAGAVVEIALDSRVNVRLMDDANFRTYSGGIGGSYNFVGGQAIRSPLRLQIPRAGHWHVALDVGGGAGQWRSGVTVRA